MSDDIMIPAIIFFSFFGYLAWRRYLEYRETAALAAHGMVRQRKPSDGRDALRWGIAIAALGLALTIGLYPFGWLLADQAHVSFPLGFGPWLLVGLVPLFFGLGLILIYAITKPDPKERGPNNGDVYYPARVPQLDNALTEATSAAPSEHEATAVARSEPGGELEAPPA